MASTTMTILSVTVACLLVAGQALGQGTQTKPGSTPDELRFNGDNGNDKQINSDTNIISDNTPQQQPQPRPSGQFGLPGQDTSLDRPSLPFGRFPGFGPINMGDSFGGSGLFGGLADPFAAPPRPFSIFDDLFGHIRRQSQNMQQNFERQFQNLERQAGEGQDVSYFNRNGVAYVRTCTTKRVSPGNDQNKQPSQVLPGGQDTKPGQQREQQVPEQQQPQQPPTSAERPQDASSEQSS